MCYFLGGVKFKRKCRFLMGYVYVFKIENLIWKVKILKGKWERNKFSS